MKKINKKYQLIVVIMIVTVILAIVILGTLKMSNNIIEREYLETTSRENSNLVASYIKEGITIGGITGTLKVLDTSDATATPEDIIWGETAYVKGKKITGTKVVTVKQGKETQKTFTENTVLTDDYGNIVKVPAGFKISPASPTKVTEGVIIEDVSAGSNETKGSQFVWVPIGNVKYSESESKNVKLGRYDFSNGTNIVQDAMNWKNEVKIDDYYVELSSSSYGNSTAKNLEDFITKSLSSQGFYIGRYEAGKGTNGAVVTKSGATPYTDETQMSASLLSRNMYANSGISDLINSYAWDTAIAFIEAFSDSDYAMQNRYQTTITTCGASNYNGNYDVRCNIYDMAANTREWNTETYTYGSRTVMRGGSNEDGESYTRGRNNMNLTTSAVYYISFRVILYL